MLATDHTPPLLQATPSKLRQIAEKPGHQGREPITLHANHVCFERFHGLARLQIGWHRKEEGTKRELCSPGQGILHPPLVCRAREHGRWVAVDAAGRSRQCFAPCLVAGPVRSAGASKLDGSNEAGSGWNHGAIQSLHSPHETRDTTAQAIDDGRRIRLVHSPVRGTAAESGFESRRWLLWILECHFGGWS